MGLGSATTVMRPIRTAVLMMVSLAAPIGASAAPFCLRSQAIPPQCIYYDASECDRDATKQGGFCEVNVRELQVRRGFGQYCVVTSTRVSACVYTDRGTCAAAAAREHGTCTEATGRAPSRAPDPYGENGQ
jgi:hypothetical protein